MKSNDATTKISIRTRRDNRLRFRANIYELTDITEFNLDPVGFYQEWGKIIPTPPHYEIEIIEPDKEFLSNHSLHAHLSKKTDKFFVCYPMEIKTVWRALQIFRIWCLGSALTLVEGIDLNEIYTKECKDDALLTERVLNERYGIRVEIEEREI